MSLSALVTTALVKDAAALIHLWTPPDNRIIATICLQPQRGS